MPTPKSITKVSKNGVTYTSDIDAAQYFIFELTRAALRDVGKFLRNEFKQLYYSHFAKITGNAGKVTSVKVWSGANTKYPRLQIGLKTGKVDGFYAYFQEFGTSRQPRLGLLASAARDNVAKIVEIESKYLSGLNGEAEALASQIDESDYDEED